MTTLSPHSNNEFYHPHLPRWVTTPANLPTRSIHQSAVLLTEHMFYVMLIFSQKR